MGADHHVKTGLDLYQRGQPDAALAAWRQALALDPHHGEALALMGSVLLEQGRAAEALAPLQAALARQANFAPLLTALGTALAAAGRVGEAEEHHRRALRADPACVEAAFNLGNLLRDTGREAAAMTAFEQVLSIRPDFAPALSNLAYLYQRTGRVGEAEELYDRAVALAPLPQAHFSRGLLRLARGRLAEGWADYDYRFAGELSVHRRDIALPFWRGERLEGRRLLVWREQGLGDEIMFASCLADLARYAADGQVVVDCDPRLRGLLARAHPNILFIAGRAEARHGDLQIPMGTLPRLLRGRLEGFGGAAPWLRAADEMVMMWRQRLAALPPGLRVGFCWRSGQRDAIRDAAYTVPSQWAPLLRRPHVRAISLQYGSSDAERAELAALAPVPLSSWPDLDLKDDLEAVAGLMVNLDLVIGVGTAVTEMAGALGVPVWRLGHGDEWTRLGTGVRPFYPTMRCIDLAEGQGIARAVTLLMGLHPSA